MSLVKLHFNMQRSAHPYVLKPYIYTYQRSPIPTNSALTYQRSPIPTNSALYLLTQPYTYQHSPIPTNAALYLPTQPYNYQRSPIYATTLENRLRENHHLGLLPLPTTLPLPRRWSTIRLLRLVAYRRCPIS